MKYKANREGLKALLRGEAAQSLVTRHGDRIANAAGDGYAASYMQGRSRFRGIVYADSMKAKVAEGRENRLVRILG